MKIKKITLAASLMLAAGTAAFAQTHANPTSNTAIVTNGVFGTDVDDYMDVNYWGGVNP